MSKPKKCEFTRKELIALALTTLAAYMEALHFDEDVARQTAELIAQLDEEYGKGHEWRRTFGECNIEIAEMVVDAVLLGKGLLERRDNNG